MPLRWLALGDSYTIGEGVAETDRWPAQAAARLRAEGVGVRPPEIVAATGWTAADLLDGLDAAATAGPVDAVTLLIGVNDQYDGVTLDAYRADLRALLDRSRALARGDAARVVVLSIPDWGATPFAADRDRGAIARAVGAFNAVVRDEAAAVGAALVDLTPLSRTQGDLVVEDGLHPSGEAYRAWAALAAPAVRAALGAG